MSLPAHTHVESSLDLCTITCGKCSVGDPAIIEPLKSARDSARAAYEQYLSKHPE